MDSVAVEMEIESQEKLPLPRAELDRLMATLYPDRATPDLYYRQAWRAILGGHLSGFRTGMDRQEEDARLEAAKTAKTAR